MPRPRSPDAEAASGDDAVQAARTRARRRLVGALVLLVAGVVGFPLLFETQPRPVAMDTPIVTATAPQAAAPRAVAPPPRPLPEIAPPPEVPASAPVAAPPAPAASKPAPRVESPPARAASAVRTEVKAESKPQPKAEARSEAKPESKAEPKAEARPEAKPESKPEAAGRFVVQAGAYSDQASLRDARQKIERLGMKTYTQVIEGDAGKRTRVRVGPFATKDEATAAAARIKAAGLPTAVLAL